MSCAPVAAGIGLAAPGETAQVVPGRTCGTCTLCCKTVAVKELNKPIGVWCPHCLRGKGCAIYDTRPASCREFYCQWMLEGALGPEWKPDRAKFAVILTPSQHITVCVDPGFPSAWRQPPYYDALKRWARACANDPSSPWPGVDVWIGARWIVILPDRDEDVGVIGLHETIKVDRRELGPPGAVAWDVRKVART